MNVSLPPQLDTYVRDLVKKGHYNSASEVVREGLRLLEEREMKLTELRRLIQEGIESGDPVPMTREDLTQMLVDHAAELRGRAETGQREAANA